MVLSLPPKKSKSAAAPSLWVVEGVESTWSYHLAVTGTLKPLCSRKHPVMGTGIPLKGWGHRSGHLPERYCKECEEVAATMGVKLGE